MRGMPRGFFRTAGWLAVVLLFSSAPVLFAQGWCAEPTQPPEPEPEEEDPRCSDPCRACQASPCLVGIGAYTTSATDLRLRTAGFPLEVARRYQSAIAIDGPLGAGWTSSLTARLYYAVYLYAAPSTYQKEAYIIMPDGARYRYVDTGSSFTPPPGRKDVLVRNADGTFTLTLERTRSSLTFGTEGALLSAMDDYGNTITYTYAAGRIQQITDSAGSGRSLTVAWGPDGRIATVQDSTGRLVQYGYTPQGSLQTATDPANRVTTYSYQAGRFVPVLNQIKDHWSRVITAVTWDTKGRVSSYTDQGETYSYTYGYGGNPSVTAKTDSLGNRWLYPFTSGGLISDTTPPSGEGGPTHTDYYPDGLVQQFIDGVGVKTFYTYNGQGNPLSVTRDHQGPTAVRFDYTYDTTFPEKAVAVIPKDPATNQYDPNWQGWRYDYHPPGSPAPGALHHVYRVRDDGVATDTLATYEYDTKGRLTRQTSAIGGVTDYGYGATGNLETVTAPANNDAGTRPVTTYGYDPVGRTTSVTDPLGHATTYAYDALDRVLTVTLPKPTPSSPLNFLTTYTYDNHESASGLLFTHITDPNGNLTKQGYNQFGQLIRALDALNNTTSYGYTRGLLTSITDAHNNVTTNAYDSAGRLYTTSTAGTTERYTYTGDNLVYQKLDRKNQTFTYAYDRHKRLSQKTYPNATSVVYTFLGQKLTQVVDTSVTPTETHLYGYDTAFRLASETQGPRGTISYQYHPDDSAASYSVQSGPTATYTYYPDASLSQITWSPASGEFRYAYTLAGQYQRITFPNGQYRDFSYDDQGRLLQLANVHPTAGNLATYGYGYDLNHATGAWDRLGQRVSMTATVPSQGLSAHQTRYEYDPLYQLTKSTYPNVAPFNGEVHSWTYDAIGNRLTNTVNGVTDTYEYLKVWPNSLNWQRLLDDGPNSYTYDSNGNATSRSGPGGNFTFGWNPDDRMTGISGAAAATYTYDYQGRRSSRTAGSTGTFLYDDLHLIRELGASTVDYLSGPGIDEPLAASYAGSVSYYQVDALGSVGLLATPTGSIQNSYLYDAWGNTRLSTASVSNPFGYTAREAGEAASLFHRARYYQPGIGRFLSEDPLSYYVYMTSRELYAYGNSAPTNNIDPLGLACTTTISRGPREVYDQTWGLTGWELAGSSRAEGNEHWQRQPPIPDVPARQQRRGRRGGSFWIVQICNWVRYFLVTDYWRLQVTVSVHCDCPVSDLSIRSWEKGKEEWRGGPQDWETTAGGMLFGAFYSCPIPTR